MSKSHSLQRIKAGIFYSIFLAAFTIAVLLRPGCQDDVCSPAPPPPYGVRTLFTRLRADGVLATMGRVAAACIICSVLQQPSEAKLPHHRKLS